MLSDETKSHKKSNVRVDQILSF